MRWTASPGFRSLVHIVLFLALSWFLLLLFLGDAVEPDARRTLGGILFWTALLAGVFAFALRSTPNVKTPYTKEWTGASSIVIHRTPEQVWHFIRDPAFAPLTSVGTERAFYVPGTPDGPGNQQVFISPGPIGLKHLLLLEVVGETPWTRVEVRNLSDPGWSTYQLESVPAGTQLTVTMAGEYARWAAHGISPRKQLEALAGQYVQNVKRVIESGAVPASHPSAPPPPPSHRSSHDPTGHGPTEPTSTNVPPPYNPGNPPPPT
jgi:hypothetical protein